jgi:hypothetical protein
VREEHGEVTETRSNGALALLCFAELIVLHLEVLPEIALIPYEHLRVDFIGGLFPGAIRARHPGDADAVAVRQKVLCRLGVCCDAGGGSPLRLSRCISLSALRRTQPIRRWRPECESLSLGGHLGSNGLLRREG